MSRFAYRRGVERELSRDPALGPALLPTAKSIEGEAQRLARAEAFDTGAYHDSIRATHGEERGEQKARVNAGDRDAFYAHWIEFGTAPRVVRTGRMAGVNVGSVTPKAILRRAAEAAGRQRRDR